MFKKKIDLTNKLPEKIFNSIFSLFCIFEKANAELYLVGGCVRDMLLGRQPKDYDLCTNLTPDQVKEVLGKEGKVVEWEELHFLHPELEAEVKDLNKYIRENNPEPIFVCDYSFIDTGLKHGTVTIHDKWNNLFFEITTYRVDGKYTDGRHPDNIKFTPSLEEDLKRRDFTINSFAYNLLNKEVTALDESYFKDLEYGIIKTVGDPCERFMEDALRMLRALRFAAQLNFAIETNTYNAIKKLSNKIDIISKERVRDELTKILMSDNPQLLELVIATHLEYPLFRGLTPLTDMIKCEHQNPHHYTDVFHHTIDVVKKVPKKFELKWAALLHDVGKPKVKTLKPGTTNHYRYVGHEEVSVEIAAQLMDILKFSNEQKEIILKYIQYHDMDLVSCRNSKFKKVVVDIGKDHFIDFIKLRAADSFAHQLTVETKYAIDFIDKLIQRFDNVVIEDQPLTLKDLAINGNDIIADGFLEGKEIGECLNWLLNIVLENPEENTREKLLNYLEMYKEMSFQST